MSTQLLTHYVQSIGDVDALELDPWELPTGEWGVTVTGENVEYAGKFLYLSEDKRVAVGIERLGPSRPHGTHRRALLPEGQHPLQAAGRAYRLKAGDYCYFPPASRLGDRETYVKPRTAAADRPGSSC